MEERIIKLETLSAMQDETIRQLNDEIYQQQLDLSRLENRVERLEKKIAEIDQPEQIGGNERPPHY